LQRREFPPERIAAIRKAYRVLQQSTLNLSQGLAQLEQEKQEDIDRIIKFVRDSQRGVIIKRGRDKDN
jgi:acyl-[acyl carrier protein]--UDP-N-acetylglucosamine O-acyltransferase